MVDWLTVGLPVSDQRRVHGGRVVHLSPLGEVMWSADKGFVCRGSFDGAIQAKSDGGTLWVSGNPVKWVQGHNVYGGGDVSGFAAKLGTVGARALGLTLTAADREAWYAGAGRITRVDITRSYRLRDSAEVDSWLSAAAAVLRSRYQAPSVEPGTLYIGKHSRRIALKLYNKARELRRHELPVNVPHRDKLLALADGLLRVEVTCRARFLKEEGLMQPAAWSEARANGIIDERLAAMNLNDTQVLSVRDAVDLPPRLLAYYELWRNGHDLKAMTSRSAFYRWRRELLAYGIDIADVQPFRADLYSSERRYPEGRPLRSFLTGGGIELDEFWSALAS